MFGGRLTSQFLSGDFFPCPFFVVSDVTKTAGHARDSWAKIISASLWRGAMNQQRWRNEHEQEYGSWIYAYYMTITWHITWHIYMIDADLQIANAGIWCTRTTSITSILLGPGRYLWSGRRCKLCWFEANPCWGIKEDLVMVKYSYIYIIYIYIY